MPRSLSTREGGREDPHGGLRNGGVYFVHAPGVAETLDPIIIQKRLQTKEETPSKQDDTMCMIVFDVCHRAVLGVSSWV